MIVVVRLVASQDPVEVAGVDDKEVVQALRSTVRTNRSAWALAFGVRNSARKMSAPSDLNTSSKPATYSVSRS